MAEQGWDGWMAAIAEGVAGRPEALAIQERLDRNALMCNGASAALGTRDMFQAQLWVQRIKGLAVYGVGIREDGVGIREYGVGEEGSDEEAGEEVEVVGAEAGMQAAGGATVVLADG